MPQKPQAALDTGIVPAHILNKGCIAAMAQVGRQFEEGEMFVPEMLIAARAMQAGMNVLKPHLTEDEIVSAGKIVVGTVTGDLHDIGKNLVGMMMEGAGFEIVDLGTDVRPEAFVQAVREHEPDLVGTSALLTTTMPSMTATVEALTEAGLRDRSKSWSAVRRSPKRLRMKSVPMALRPTPAAPPARPKSCWPSSLSE